MRGFELAAILALTGVLALTETAHAQGDQEIAAQISRELRACEHDPAKGGTFQQAVCYSEEAKRQDQRLNETWKRLPPSRRAALLGGEREWIKRRDAVCQDAAADYRNSTANYMYGTCYVNETIKRRLWLVHGR